MPQKPFDEYHVGETFDSYARTITEANIVNFTCFAGLKLPIFIESVACLASNRNKRAIDHLVDVPVEVDDDLRR